MYRTTLISVLISLTAKELKSFGLYMDSPVFTRNRNLIKLYEVIAKAAPDFEEGLAKEDVFAQVFPDKPYAEENLRNLCSDLLEHLEQFLRIQELQNDRELSDRLLLRQLKKRKLYSRFFSTFKKVFKRRKKQKIRDVQWFEEDYGLLSELNEVHGHRQDEDYDRSLQLRINQLDHHYLSSKLSVSCEILNRKNIYNKQLHSRLLEPILAVIENDLEYYRQIPAIYLYYLVLQTLREPEDAKHYNNLVKQLHTQVHNFSKGEGRALYKYAQNYCIQKINKGENKYLASLLGIYKKLLASELILEEGRLSDSDYRNIVTVGLRLKEFDWVEYFIHQYESFLSKDQKGNAYAYNLAAYYYEKSEYGKAQELLNELEFSNVFYSLGVKSLLVKIYFDNKESEALFSLIKSFKTYLKRNKQLSRYQVRIYNNLLKFTQQAARLQQNKEIIDSKILKKSKSELMKEVDSTKEIANINWLKTAIEKI